MFPTESRSLLRRGRNERRKKYDESGGGDMHLVDDGGSRTGGRGGVDKSFGLGIHGGKGLSL